MNIDPRLFEEATYPIDPDGPFGNSNPFPPGTDDDDYWTNPPDIYEFDEDGDGRIDGLEFQAYLEYIFYTLFNMPGEILDAWMRYLNGGFPMGVNGEDFHHLLYWFYNNNFMWRVWIRLLENNPVLKKWMERQYPTVDQCSSNSLSIHSLVISSKCLGKLAFDV